MNSYFLEIVAKRRSCRAYIRGRNVEREKINYCLEAARLAPSACNKQPCRFVIVTDAALKKIICEKGLLPGINMSWLDDAPVIVVLCANLSLITHHIAPMLSDIKYHYIDAGIAGEHFVLMAEELGLATCWIGWFNEKVIKKTVGIPNNIKVVSLISLGYPCEKNPPQNRERISINEIAHDNLWGHKSK